MIGKVIIEVGGKRLGFGRIGGNRDDCASYPRAAMVKFHGNRTDRAFSRRLESRKASSVKHRTCGEDRVSHRSEKRAAGMSIKRSEIQPRRLPAGRSRPTFTRCRRILPTSSGSVITARIRIGEPHRLQVNGSTSYT